MHLQSMGSILESSEIAKKAVEVALDKQAVDILLLDIKQVSCFADYFVICSADSDRQIRAICDNIGDRAVVEQAGIKDILTKSLGTNNAINVVKATMNGLINLMDMSEVLKNRGKTFKELFG